MQNLDYKDYLLLERTCQEKSGFLFKHRCDRPSVLCCVVCAKCVCDFHGHQTPMGTQCAICLRSRDIGSETPNDSVYPTAYHSRYHHYQSTNSFQNNDPRVTISESGVDPSDDSASNLGDGDFTEDIALDEGDGNFGNDPADFTEGDSEAFQDDSGKDMGAS